MKVLQHSFLEKKHQRAVLPETWKHNSNNDFNVLKLKMAKNKNLLELLEPLKFVISSRSPCSLF